MRAITVVPRQAGSARLDDVPEPDPKQGAVLVDGLALGICGTDGEIIRGDYGWAPEGEERLVLGHESLGRVRECPDDARLSPGDLVVGIVRRPDPVPCACCARGEWDFCRNGRYTERGIKEIHGYGSERWRVEPDFAVRIDPGLEDVGVLLEPTSVVTKAWEQIDRIGGRACFDASRVLVTGAGPIGLLAALLAVQRGHEVHVVDQVTEGPKPELVRRLGATYHSGGVKEAGEVDIVVEATGVGQVVVDALGATARNGIVCLTGVSSGERSIELDIAGLNRSMVLENDVVFGSVNAARRHYEDAAESLARADRDWLRALITRRVPLERWQEVLERRPDDVKVVVALDSAS
ncbi:MAG: glucose 1-dehydrogenase [Solirubrobacteraceae bacterium]|nr:glucose 1-dehydrogenase [Solirubrobacteraceae bacterium]